MASSSDVDTTKIDFYDFLGLPGPAATAKEINRAGRQTSFRYHPDKVAATPENLEKFHIAQVAIGVLSDPAEKSKYDQQRDARLRRKAEVDALDDRRRKMASDLEARESLGAATNVVAGQKRTFSEREVKIRRAQEENRRKVEERNARIKPEAEQRAAQERAKATKADTADSNSREPDSAQVHTNGDNANPSMSNSVRIRWLREGEMQAYDENSVREFLGPDVEEVILLKDKKRKVDGQRVMLGVAVAMFTTVKAAEHGMRKCRLSDDFESVEWVNTGKVDETEMT